MKKSKKIALLIFLGILISSFLGFGITALGSEIHPFFTRSSLSPRPGAISISIAIILIGIILIIPFKNLLRKRVFTREENILLKEFNGLEDLKNKNLISKEDFNKKREAFFKDFFKALSNKSITFAYKIETLSSLKDKNVISEGEFKEAKKQLIEQTK